MKKRLKIAFISAMNVSDQTGLSGAPYHISRLLDRFCGDVFFIHNFRPKKITLKFLLVNLLNEFTPIYIGEKLKEFFWAVLGKRYEWERTYSFAKYYSKKISAELLKNNFDIIFAEKASIQIAFLNTTLPIVYESDATFAAMLNYYPKFKNPSQSFLKNGHDIEKKAIENSRLFICTSQWAADSAEKKYDCSIEKIAIIPHPPAFEELPTKELVLKEKKCSICHLLFVGVEWDRKGGEVAVETMRELNRLGVKTDITICGCVPPTEFMNAENIIITGFLNKNIKEEREKLKSLFLNSHFFILPTTAECLGMVFLEAMGFGLPIITYHTGGIPSLIKNEENGILFDLKANHVDFAKEIKRIWTDKNNWKIMCKNSRERFDENFTSEIIGEKYQKSIEKILNVK